MVISALGNGIAQYGSRSIDRRFTRSFRMDSLLNGHSQYLMKAAGVTLEKVIKTRADGRQVFLVKHPKWGRSVLKTTHALTSSSAGLANLHLAELATSSGAPFFPRVHVATADYTIEEFIDGTPLRAWLEQDFRMGPIEALLNELKDWGSGPGPWHGEPKLLPEEIQAIVLRYVSKCIGQGVYFSTRRRLAGIYDLFRRRGEIERDLEWLMGEAETIAIPRGKMCGDLSNVNLIVSPAQDRIYIVDYEFTGPGHIAFDTAYLLTSLDKIPTCPDATRAIGNFVHSERFAGSARHVQFFAALNGMLTGISRSVYGHRVVL